MYCFSCWMLDLIPDAVSVAKVGKDRAKAGRSMEERKQLHSAGCKLLHCSYLARWSRKCCRSRKARDLIWAAPCTVFRSHLFTFDVLHLYIISTLHISNGCLSISTWNCLQNPNWFNLHIKAKQSHITLQTKFTQYTRFCTHRAIWWTRIWMSASVR